MANHNLQYLEPAAQQQCTNCVAHLSPLGSNPLTSSPDRRSTGRLSPVMCSEETMARPCTISPSSGTCIGHKCGKTGAIRLPALLTSSPLATAACLQPKSVAIGGIALIAHIRTCSSLTARNACSPAPSASPT